jgi:uncharacterized protein (DUF2384 family)
MQTAGHSKLDPITDVRQAVTELFADPEQWLNAPNEHLGGEAPIDLIARNDVEPVRNVLESIRHGMFT